MMSPLASLACLAPHSSLMAVYILEHRCRMGVFATEPFHELSTEGGV